MIKSDNSHFHDKIFLRETVIKESGFLSLKVLDCCCGSRQIWRTLKQKCKIESYLGIDEKNPAATISMDSVRYLQGLKTLDAFNVIDVDTYGSPWKHFEQIRNKARKEFLLFLTVGQVMTGIDKLLWQGLGIPKSAPQALKARVRLLGEEKILSTVLGKFHVLKAYKIEPSDRIKYIGLHLKPINS